MINGTTEISSNDEEGKEQVSIDPDTGWENHQVQIGDSLYAWAVDLKDGHIVTNAEEHAWADQWDKTHPRPHKTQSSGNQPNTSSGDNEQGKTDATTGDQNHAPSNKNRDSSQGATPAKKDPNSKQNDDD